MLELAKVSKEFKDLMTRTETHKRTTCGAISRKLKRTQEELSQATQPNKKDAL